MTLILKALHRIEAKSSLPPPPHFALTSKRKKKIVDQAEDANQHSFPLTSWFGVRADHSLADALSGRITWTELVHNTSRNFDCDWNTLLAEMKDHYPWVLLNAVPPDNPFVLQLGSHCDGVYLALRLHRTSQQETHRAIDLLNRHGTHILGSVVVAE